MSEIAWFRQLISPVDFRVARKNEAAGTADAAAWVIAGVCDFALR
jgi:hypothetical protein